MRPVGDDAVEERLALDALAHEPALHVGDGDHHRVDLARSDQVLEFDELGVLDGMAAVVAHEVPPTWAGADRRAWVVNTWDGPSIVRPGARCARRYLAVIPPSATSTEPVTNDDSSEARNRATLAISRGSPGRPMGWNESISS